MLGPVLVSVGERRTASPMVLVEYHSMPGPRVSL